MLIRAIGTGTVQHKVEETLSFYFDLLLMGVAAFHIGKLASAQRVPHARLIPQVVRVSASLFIRAIVEIEHRPANITGRCWLCNDSSDDMGEFTVHSFFANAVVKVYAGVIAFVDMGLLALPLASFNFKVLVRAESLNEFQLIPQLFELCELIVAHGILFASASVCSI